MTEKLTKTEAVGRLVQLAKDVDISDNIDWASLNISEDNLYEMMANSVIDQMQTVPQEYKDTIQMGTMTKLLVENFVLKAKLQQRETLIQKNT